MVGGSQQCGFIQQRGCLSMADIMSPLENSVSTTILSIIRKLLCNYNGDYERRYVLGTAVVRQTSVDLAHYMKGLRRPESCNATTGV